MLLKKFIFPLLLVTGAAGAQAQESWVISAKEASCLFENLDAYLESKAEPVVIFIRLCPVTDPVEAMRKMQKNSGSLPTAPSVTIAPDGSPFDEYIVYSQLELACLKEMAIQSTISPVRLPHNPCG
jgi:hypothetical protein